MRLVDQGGRVVFGPALMLVEHANQAKQQVVLKMAEMAGLGLSAGLSGAAVKVTFLVWCDRVAIVLGVLTSLVDEHRGWILERYGEAGERFLFSSDVVSSAVALYGVARVVTAAPKLVRGLRDSYARFKAVERGALPDVERRPRSSSTTLKARKSSRSKRRGRFRGARSRSRRRGRRGR